MCSVSQFTKDIRNDGLAENTAELNAVIQRNAFHSEETLLLFVFAEFDQVTAFVLLVGVCGTIAFKPHTDLIEYLIIPLELSWDIDAFRQCGQHLLLINVSDLQMNGLDDIRLIKRLLTLFLCIWSMGFAGEMPPACWRCT